MSLEQMDAKAKRNYFEAWRDSVETVSAVFELGGRMPAEERSADGKVRPVAMRPIPLPELTGSVTAMVEEIAADRNAWDKDAIHVEDIPQIISEAVVRTISRAAEPNLVLTSLLQSVPMELSETFSEEFLGTIPGTADWISPNDEPPHVEPIDSGATVGIQLRKFGLMMNFSEEVLARSKWPLIQMHVQEAAKDMARFKERQTAIMLARNAGYLIQGKTGGASPDDTITRYGQTVAKIDGATATTGRKKSDLALNATLTLDDLFDMMAHLITRNVFPDILVMHPFAWKIFATNGELREFAKINGQTPIMRAPHGDPGGIYPQHRPGRIVPTQQNYSQQATLQVDVPDLFPRPLTIIVSPFVQFDASSNRSDIVMAVSGQVGYSLDGDGPNTNRWNDPLHDMQAIKITEFWNVGVKNEGHYLVSAVDIALDRSADWSSGVSLSSLPD
jgi:hypothetical protein